MLLIAEVAKRHIAAASDVIAQCKRVLAQSRKLCNQAEPDRRRKSA